MAKNIIHVEALRKSYGKNLAVNNVSFSVGEAECFGLLGPNGAGKTTAMKALYGRAKRDASQDTAVSVFGYDPADNELKIKNLSGIVPQEDNLDEELNVYQNLYVYSKFYGMDKVRANKRINELLDFLELSEKKGDLIKELSGGMKRRLTIARALLGNPRLLILDEPTTGLDPQVRHMIWDKLKALKNQGVTILITTHYMEEAFQICDRIMIMDKAEKKAEGSPKKLLEENIETYVMEITRQGVEDKYDKIKQQKLRTEEFSEMLLIYSNEIERLRDLASDLSSNSYFIRQANLEDVFLKITGRALNERQ